METQHFSTWMTEQNYSKRTIKDYEQIVRNAPEIKRYEDLIAHIKTLQSQVKATTINQRLIGLKKYYQYQKEQGLISHNIAHKVQVRNSNKPFLTVLSEEELTALYDNYPSITEVQLRRKVLLGLLIYQGIDLGTTKNLKVEDISLDKSEIYLPGARRMNARRLALKGSQVLPFYRYLENLDSRMLFRNEKHLMNQYEALKNDLQKQSRKVESIRQIRSSVITNWLDHYNLREVQYYCGHKHIGSTEAYKRVDLESMKSDLKKYHPLGGI